MCVHTSTYTNIVKKEGREEGRETERGWRLCWRKRIIRPSFRITQTQFETLKVSLMDQGALGTKGSVTGDTGDVSEKGSPTEAGTVTPWRQRRAWQSLQSKIRAGDRDMNC